MMVGSIARNGACDHTNAGEATAMSSDDPQVTYDVLCAYERETALIDSINCRLQCLWWENINPPPVII